MISTRIRFLLVALFLVMVVTIRSAPVEESTVEDSDTIEETSELAQVVTDKLLFANVTVVPINENMKEGASLLFDNPGETPVFPSTVDPQSFQVHVSDLSNITQENVIV